MRYGDDRYNGLLDVLEIEDYFERWDAFYEWMEKMGWQ